MLLVVFSLSMIGLALTVLFIRTLWRHPLKVIGATIALTVTFGMVVPFAQGVAKARAEAVAAEAAAARPHKPLHQARR